MLKDGSRLDFPYQESNLPIMITEEHLNDKASTVVLTCGVATVMASIDVSRKMNQKLTNPQKELMLWHLKWAHCDMGRVQILRAKTHDEEIHQLIKPNHETPLSCPNPKWAACCPSNIGRSSTSITAVLDSSDQNLNNDAPNPSGVVHLDQYMSGLPGRLPQPFGKRSLKHASRGYHIH
jgi:hypothetical protein